MIGQGLIQAKQGSACGKAPCCSSVCRCSRKARNGAMPVPAAIRMSGMYGSAGKCMEPGSIQTGAVMAS